MRLNNPTQTNPASVSSGDHCPSVLSSVCHPDMTQTIRECDSFCYLDVKLNIFIKALNKNFKCFYCEAWNISFSWQKHTLFLCVIIIYLFSPQNGIFLRKADLSRVHGRSIFSEKKWRQMLLFILFSVKKTKSIESPWWTGGVPPSRTPPAGKRGPHQRLHACAAVALHSSVWWRQRQCHF